MLDSEALVQGWLSAAMTWGMLPLGAVAVLMTHRLTGGRWGKSSRHIWLVLAATMPLFVLSLLPLLLSLDVLFPWNQPLERLPEVVRNKRLYLNEPFFVVRLFLYSLVWLLLSWSQGGYELYRPTTRVRLPAAAGLILWFFTITFFAFDWFMSLEPRFYSDVFGLMLCMGAVCAALAVGMLMYPAEHSDNGPRRDLANLWLTLLLAWAFMAFSQYIIIWSGNLPDEIGWYVHRSEGLWRTLSVVSFALFFLLPFAVLLSGAAKSSRGWLAFAAVSCLIGHGLQMAWLILPAFEQGGDLQLVLATGFFFTLGALYVGCAVYALSRVDGHRNGEGREPVGGAHA